METISALPQSAISRGRWGIHLTLITGYIVAVGLLGLRRRGTHIAALSNTVGGLLFTCSRELLIFALIFGLACLASQPTRDDLMLRWRGKIKPVLLGIGYSFALRLALGIFIVAISIGLMVTQIVTPESLKNYASANRPDLEMLIDMAAMRNNPIYYWLTLTVVSLILAGVREELWRSAFLAGMKGVWPHYFGTSGGRVLAVFIGAVLFGLGHLAMGSMAVGLTGLLGMGLGLIMIYHGSIWPAVIAHGLFDATSMAMLPWAAGHTS